MINNNRELDRVKTSKFGYDYRTLRSYCRLLDLYPVTIVRDERNEGEGQMRRGVLRLYPILVDDLRSRTDLVRVGSQVRPRNL